MLVRGAHGLAGAGLPGAGALGQGVMRCSCGCFRTVGRRRAQASRDATRLMAVLPLLKRRIELCRDEGHSSREFALLLGKGLEFRRRLLAYAHGARRSLVPGRHEWERWARAAGVACEEVVARDLGTAPAEREPAIAWRARSD